MTATPPNHTYPLQSYGLIKISGADSLKFLQGQLSCDMTKITPTSGSMVAHCNPKGRVLSLCYALYSEDAYFLVTPLSMVTVAMIGLKKYAQFYKTTLSDVTSEYAVMGCTTELIPKESLCYTTLPATSSRKIYLATNLRHENTSDEWKQLDITDQLPAIYPETSGLFLPHELNLPHLGAISFDKGCFTGQEIIARMHYRATLKKRMYLAYSESLHEPGHEIHRDSAKTSTIATVVDSSRMRLNNKYPTLITANDADINSEIFTDLGISIQTQQSETK